jgi:hypothetical protein
MQIRSYLFLMAAGILVPVIIASGLALNMLQDAEKAAALRGLNEAARGVSLMVDRELYSAEAALQVLAASPALARHDLPAFYREAKTASRGATGWTLLLDRNGDQLINTSVPFGSALPKCFYAPIMQQIMASQATIVSDLLSSPTSKFSTDHFNRLVTAVNAPPGWLVAIVDGKGRFIARSRNADQLVGKPARAELVAAARRAANGQIRHSTLENVDSYDVFTHSKLSGWTVAVAAPVELIERLARHAALFAPLLAAIAAQPQPG